MLLLAGPLRAQERVWKINDELKLVSTNLDGSDPKVIELDPNKYGEYVGRLIKLDNGNIVFITEYGGTHGFGVISAITPGGFVVLYSIGDYNTRFSQNMVDGGDGYLYALQSSVMSAEYFGVAAFKIDGTEYRQGNSSIRKLINNDPLTVTSDGIYGTSNGQASEKGFLFKLDQQNLSVQKIFSFTSDANGIRPFGKVTEGIDGMLYGTTRIGGVANQGVIFRIKKDGTQYTKLYDFRQDTGMNPEGQLVQDKNGTFYGVTTKGGRKGKGVLFSFTESGQYTRIFDFYEKGLATPRDHLIIGADGFIYGNSSLFKVKPDGTGFEKTQAPYPVVTLPVNFMTEEITNPLDLSDSLPVNLVVQVKPMKGALTYDLQLSTSPDLTVSVSSFTSKEPRFSLKNLAYNTTYYVRARSSAWPFYGAVTSFTTGGQQNLPDVYLVNPGNQKSDKPIWTTYEVKNVSGASQYVLELCEYANFHGPIVHMESATSTFPGMELKYETTYYARAKTNLSGFGPVTSFTTRGVLGYTFLSGPKGGTTNVPADSLNITANYVVGATTYTIETTPYFNEVYDPGDFYPDQIISSTRPAQRTFFIDNLSYETTYFTRVKTDMSQEYGDIRWFTTEHKDFKTLLPADGETGVPVNNVRVEMEAVRASYGYSFVLSETPTDFYGPGTIQQFSTSNYSVFSGLKYNTRYYVFARSYRTPYFNATTSFTTQAPPATAATVSVYPNPTTTGFTVEKGKSRIQTLALISADGTTLFTAGTADKYTFGTQLPKGFYYLKVITDSGVEMHRLVKE